MYDLNLNIPNITAQKYTTDNRFLLLKNYLCELNEKISFALTDKVETEINTLSEKYEKEQEESRNEVYNYRAQNTNNYNELNEKISGLYAFESLNCECTSAVVSPVSYIRYYPSLNVVYVRLSFSANQKFTAGTTYVLARITERVPDDFVPLQCMASLSSGGQSTAGIANKTGNIMFRSDTDIADGCRIYISGWYPSDYEEGEG